MRKVSLSKTYASRKAVTRFIVTQNEQCQNVLLGCNSNIIKQSTISLIATNVKDYYLILLGLLKSPGERWW
jgi:hypothetical protein